MKTFLDAPYREKDEAKHLGARRSPGHKKWYVENKENLRPFLRWMPEHLRKPCRRKKS